eukprot:GHVQ01014209.1.p3 GENE.GHVQ01014209.1~~GHVQ01014209.1.p3  ORF type:complete len:163 (+),score=36.92 GHVQ01014209.1:1612-2100(+)
MEQKQRQAGTASRRPKKKRRHKDELEDEEEDNEAGAFELLNKTRGGLMNLEQEQSAQKKAAEAEGTHQMELSKIRRAKTSEADLRKLSLECQHKIRNVTEQLKSVEDNMKRHRGADGVSLLLEKYTSEAATRKMELRRLQDEERILTEKIRGVKHHRKLKFF